MWNDAHLRIALVTASAGTLLSNSCLLKLRFNEEYLTQIMSEILFKLNNF